MEVISKAKKAARAWSVPLLCSGILAGVGLVAAMAPEASAEAIRQRCNIGGSGDPLDGNFSGGPGALRGWIDYDVRWYLNGVELNLPPEGIFGLAGDVVEVRATQVDRGGAGGDNTAWYSETTDLFTAPSAASWTYLQTGGVTWDSSEVSGVSSGSTAGSGSIQPYDSAVSNGFDSGHLTEIRNAWTDQIGRAHV